MNLTAAHVQRLAEESGFRADNLERVLRLIDLLNALRSHPYLNERMALKGGTALNLFLFPLPRLSVDIDLNYVGARERDAMLEERPKVELALRAVCEREGYTVRRMPEEHAGGKWRVAYRTVHERPATLEFDVNFLLRVPLWDVQRLDSIQVGPLRATRVPLLDIHELAAGKLAALLDRTAGRDLYDVCALLARDDLDMERLRLAFVVYGGVKRQDWRTVRIEDVEATPEEIDRRLVPLLRTDQAPARASLASWSAALVSECRARLSSVLPLRANEVEFLTELNERGHIEAASLTDDQALQARIASQPGLLWKAQNVRRHVGLDTDATGQ